MDTTNLFTVLLLGDRGVGKTSLASQLVAGESCSDPTPTVGIEMRTTKPLFFPSKPGSTDRCGFQLWDISDDHLISELCHWSMHAHPKEVASIDLMELIAHGQWVVVDCVNQHSNDLGAWNASIFNLHGICVRTLEEQMACVKGLTDALRSDAPFVYVIRHAMPTGQAQSLWQTISNLSAMREGVNMAAVFQSGAESERACRPWLFPCAMVLTQVFEIDDQRLVRLPTRVLHK